MTIKRIDPMSLARITGLLYAVLGLLLGALLSVISFTMASILPTSVPSQFGVFRMLFGVGAVILLPCLYGALGFVGGLLSAAIYNGLAKAIGGVVIEISPPVGQS